MGIEYLSCGNVMSDRIEHKDGSYSDWNMGGPAFFGLSGIRLWTKQCKLVCKTGSDFKDSYGVWMNNNNISQSSVQIEMENTTKFTLEYTKGGVFIPKRHYSEEHLGYLKTSPQDINNAATPSVKGIYLAQNTDEIFWEQLNVIKKKYGFKIMWEVEYAPSYRKNISNVDFLKNIKKTLEVADMWSINHNEASHLFDIPRENDREIIARLQDLHAEMVFYRMGKRGSCVILKDSVHFCESIDPFGKSTDPTGCGNNSTAASMYAYVSGNDPGMVATMANISSGFNAAQYGPFPLYTDEKTAYAKELAEEYSSRVKTKYPF